MPTSSLAFRCATLAFAAWAVLPLASYGADLSAPVLVRDFSPGAGAAKIIPQAFAAIEEELYFSGFDAQHGQEPWVSDGSAAGTRRLADLCPGPCSSHPAGFIRLGEKILFGARGTEAVYAIEGGQVEEIASRMYQPESFVRLGDVVFYATTAYGAEMVYRSDGTRAGTYPAADFCTAAPCYPPFPLAGDTSGGIYFARNGRLNRLPAEGHPVLVHPDLDDASLFTKLDAHRVVFQGCNFEPYDCRAWVSDGTPAGTFPLEPAAAGTLTRRAENFLAWQGRIYFSNQDFAWASTDGTVAGTRPESIFVAGKARLLAAAGDRLFYELRSETESGGHFHLRALSGNGNSVELLAGSGDLGLLGQVGDKIFLSYPSDDAPTTRLLAATDGTPAGTVVLGEHFSSTAGVAFEGQLYFGSTAAPDYEENGLWRSNGQPSGTVELMVDSPDPSSSRPEPFRLGSSLVVNVRPSGDGNVAVWRVDPLGLGLQLADPRPLWIQRAGKDVAFANLYTGNYYADLAAITEEAVVNLGDGSPYGRVADDDHFFYSTRSPLHDLWESDGTATGTRLLFDLGEVYSCGPIVHQCDPAYSDIATSGDKVFFLTRGAGPDYDDWDLTVYVRGSAEYRKIRRATFFSTPIAMPGGRVAFLAQDPPENRAVWWITDGSEAGTYPLFALPDSHPIPGTAVAARSRLFFVIRGGGQDSLWASGLEPGSAAQLTASLPLSMTQLVAAGDRVYFTGAGSETGQEIGLSDGTPSTTRWLDLKSGGAGSAPRDLFATTDGRVVFAASADAAGDELWISDGTPAGSLRLTDLAPGGAAASPDHFAQVGKRLFFQATDGDTGRELWALDLPAQVLPCPEGRICLQSGHFDIEVTAHTQDGDFPGKKASGTADAAIFTFFSENNWEMLVKVLDGCSINQKFWVFAASATDVAFTLKVTHRDTGAEKVYTNPPGKPAVAVTDSAAFSCL